MIGKVLKVKIDRPLGSSHPDYPEHIYPINYGYVEGIIAPDGEEQDVYVLGVDKAVDEYEGELIAVIKRDDDVEDIVLHPHGMDAGLKIRLDLVLIARIGVNDIPCPVRVCLSQIEFFLIRHIPHPA